MDGDGSQGLKAVKVAGGVTFAQCEATAKFDSMPNTAMETGICPYFERHAHAVAGFLPGLGQLAFQGVDVEAGGHVIKANLLEFHQPVVAVERHAVDRLRRPDALHVQAVGAIFLDKQQRLAAARRRVDRRKRQSGPDLERWLQSALG